MPRRTDLEVDTAWTQDDALALLDDHDGCVPAAMVRLGTIRDMELARLERVIRTYRLACRRGARRRRLDELHRETRIAIGNETQRRILLLQDVARAHGLLREADRG